MDGKFRCLGVTLMASLAIGALAAPAARALEAEAYPAVLTASQTKEHVAGFGELSATCESVTGAGLVPAAVEAFALDPTFAECTMFGFVEGVVEAEGCEYVFDAAEAIEAGRFNGTTDIVCEPGDAIIYAGGNCVVEVGPQEGLGAIELVNTEGSPEDVTIVSGLAGIAYNVLVDGFLCPFPGVGEFANGTTTGTETLTGWEEGGGGPLAIWLP